MVKKQKEHQELSIPNVSLPDFIKKIVWSQDLESLDISITTSMKLTTVTIKPKTLQLNEFIFQLEHNIRIDDSTWTFSIQNKSDDNKKSLFNYEFYICKGSTEKVWSNPLLTEATQKNYDAERNEILKLQWNEMYGSKFDFSGASVSMQTE